MNARQPSRRRGGASLTVGLLATLGLAAAPAVPAFVPAVVATSLPAAVPEVVSEAVSAAAQTERSAGDDLDDAVDDLFHVWSGPARIDSDDLAPLAAVTGGALVLGFLDGSFDDWIRDHPRSLPVRLTTPFREGGPLEDLGRTQLLLPLSLLLYLAGHVADDEALRDAGVGCAAANVTTTLARTTFTRIPGRLRPGGGRGPYAFRPFTFDDWDYRSLPSGHAANVAACTSFWARRFDLGVGEPLLHALAAVVGLGRMADGAHWASDAFLGLSMGWAVGSEVARRSAGRRAADPASTELRVRPALSIGWRIPF